jgi:hypothetical protein
MVQVCQLSLNNASQIILFNYTLTLTRTPNNNNNNGSQQGYNINNPATSTNIRDLDLMSLLHLS